jgi:hypothetical protein
MAKREAAINPTVVRGSARKQVGSNNYCSGTNVQLVALADEVHP